MIRFHYCLALLACLISLATQAENLLRITVDKTEFFAGETIPVSLDKREGLQQGAWIGIFNAAGGYESYLYVTDDPKHSYPMSAPNTDGDYELRLIRSSSDETVMARLPLRVKSLQANALEIKLAAPQVAPGTKFKASLATQLPINPRAWIGIFPTSVPQGSATGYLSYEYIANQREFSFTAPELAGDYELRFFDDSAGKQITRTALAVGYAKTLNVAVRTDKEAYAPEAPMKLSFVSHSEFPRDAWIGLFKAEQDSADPADGYLTFQYLEKRPEGELLFHAPTEKGVYEARMFSSNGGAMVAKQGFNVTHDLNAEALKKHFAEAGKLVLYGIYFDHDKSELKPESHSTLTALLQFLRDTPELAVEIQGHTDNVGDESYNMNLSQRRAQAVQQWLSAQGIAAVRLSAKGYGESRPVNQNLSAAEQALNRRVEIVKR